jgi:hypothetical protein
VSDALQNAVHITFKMGYEDANKIASGFLDCTPKKELSFWGSLFAPLDSDRILPDDKDGQDRTAWARVIRDLRRQECLVHVGEKTFKMRTLAIDDVPGNKRELHKVKETYANILLTKRERIERDGKRGPQTSAKIVSLDESRKKRGQNGKTKKSGKERNVQDADAPAQHTIAWMPDDSEE